MRPSRISPFPRLIRTLLGASLLAIPLASFAAPGETSALQEWIGLESANGIINGNVDLTATLRNSQTRGSIAVSLEDIPGIYTVSTVTISSGSTVTLGALNVKTPPPRLSFEPGLGSALFGARQSPFPAGFSPFDVAEVIVSDSNGINVSSAILAPPSYGFYSALTPLTSGTPATLAGGYALIRTNGAPPPASLPTLTAGAPVIVTPIDGAINISAGATGEGAECLTCLPSGYSGVSAASSTGFFVFNNPNPNGPILGPRPPTLTGTYVCTSGSTITTGSLTLSGGTITIGTLGGLGGPGFPVVTGTGTLSLAGGTLIGTGSGNLFLTSGLILTTGAIGFSDGSTYSGGVDMSGLTLALTDSNSYVAGTTAVSGTLRFLSGGSLAWSNDSINFTIVTGSSTTVTQDEYPTVNFGRTPHPIRARTKAQSPPPPVTGELSIRAHGLPPNTSLAYFADGATLGTATTDSRGNLVINVTQGGPNTLSSTVDLYTVKTVTIEDNQTNILLTAQF